MANRHPRGAAPAADESVDPAEIAKFAAMAEDWWDPGGKFRPLHKLNPTRLRFIRDRVAAGLARDPLSEKPLSGVKLLDIGCGGGLLAEPMTRLGARVTAIDVTEENIAVARLHAEQSGLDIDYRHCSAESLVAAAERFDVVLNMEVLEHVIDVKAFVSTSAELVVPGGSMFAATLNRTVKSYFLAIVGAEYLLGWLPRGTHDWNRFVKPSELAAALRSGGMTLKELTGVVYDPLSDSWRLAPRNLDVNYMVMAVKA
jgi:2-polyprenyl-6-hydroxyphenyl methylase/3-demethylubiquinone-9 3-methyltransferase